jgi:hypothetical protein
LVKRKRNLYKVRKMGKSKINESKDILGDKRLKNIGWTLNTMFCVCNI